MVKAINDAVANLVKKVNLFLHSSTVHYDGKSDSSSKGGFKYVNPSTGAGGTFSSYTHF